MIDFISKCYNAFMKFNKTIYLHIGFMKTGSTYLQRTYFSNLSKFSKSFYNLLEDEKIRDIIKSLPYESPFSSTFEKKRKTLRNRVTKINSKNLYLSYEALIGTPYINYSNFKTIIDFFKSLFEKINILVVIRKQDDYLQSLYIQTLHEGYHQSVKSFLNYYNHEFHDATPSYIKGINLSVMSQDYYNLHKLLTEMSLNSLKFIPYELLKAKHNEFINELNYFFGVEINLESQSNDTKINRSYSRISLYIAKLLNRFLINGKPGGLRFIPEKPMINIFIKHYEKTGHLHWKILRGVSARISLRFLLQHILDRIIYIKPRPLNTKLRKKIMDFHAYNNSQLDKKLNLDLKDYGYY